MVMKIAAIPDNTRVIINKGKMDYPELKVGDRIEIYEEEFEITDPSSGNYIDTYGKTKETLTITNIYDNYSVARKVVTSNTLDVITPLLSNKNVQSYLNNKNVKSYQNLNVDSEEIQDSSRKISNIIHIGDSVRLIY
ncbi:MULTISPECIES: hypothetical protein [Aerococcus]|uniref:hypothetical protein n=1 Tax=Aerococcus TaxID=1375 RepID=UPI000DCE90DC|nr:hypothetical protein [Aerococcus urinae]RAV71472.1 hypothetical protein DBT40_03965 [Aerococcus urinae]RAW05171.1 hypothetical protein DBT41_04870 [Aerococcus urinae]